MGQVKTITVECVRAGQKAPYNDHIKEYKIEFPFEVEKSKVLDFLAFYHGTFKNPADAEWWEERLTSLDTILGNKKSWVAIFTQPYLD